MVKKVFVVVTFIIFFLIRSETALAHNIHMGAGDPCKPTDSSIHCIEGYSCKPLKNVPGEFRCQEADPVEKAFGSITPPIPLQQFIGTDPTGAGGISRFLSNFVALFYSLAGIVLIFMLLWGAWDWMTSEGDKEKLESAKKKIINAIIGIVLFSIAFALIRILGQFTGFKFFVGQ